jgi:alpha-glucosidase
LRWQGKWRYGFWFEQNGIPATECYCFELEPEKIVKDGQHNEKLWRDGFVQAILWLGY